MHAPYTFVSVLTAVLLSAGGARADDDPAPARTPTVEAPETTATPRRAGFGAAGTLVLSDLLGFGYGIVGIAPTLSSLPTLTGWVSYANGTSTTQGMTVHSELVSLSPSLDVFLADGFSLGGEIALFQESNRDGAGGSSKLAGASVKPRVGFVVPLGPTFAFWPRAFGSLGATRATGAIATESALTGIGWGVGADAQLVGMIAKPLMLTFGPSLAYSKSDVSNTVTSNSDSSLTLGVRGGISLAF